MGTTKVHINDHGQMTVSADSLELIVEDRISTGRPEIVVAKDHVLICGQCVIRPLSISPSQWLKYWERVR